MVWSCLPIIRSGQNHIARHSRRGKKGKKTRQTEEEVGRKHQKMNRPGVHQVLEDSGEQGKMEETGSEIICGAPTTIAVKGQMMMCWSVSSFVRWGEFLTRSVLESVCSFGGWWVLLQAPCWNLFDSSPGGKSLLYVGLGVSLTHPLLESVPSFN